MSIIHIYLCIALFGTAAIITCCIWITRHPCSVCMYSDCAHEARRAWCRQRVDRRTRKSQDDIRALSQSAASHRSRRSDVSELHAFYDIVRLSMFNALVYMAISVHCVFSVCGLQFIVCSLFVRTVWTLPAYFWASCLLTSLCFCLPLWSPPTWLCTQDEQGLTGHRQQQLPVHRARTVRTGVLRAEPAHRRHLHSVAATADTRDDRREPVKARCRCLFWLFFDYHKSALVRMIFTVKKF